MGVVGMCRLYRGGSLLGRCVRRVHSIRVRHSTVHFHAGVRQVNRMVTCRVDGALSCGAVGMVAPLKITPAGIMDSGIIITSVLHTKLPLRGNILSFFSGTRGYFISTCHGCASRIGFSIRIRCVTVPSIGNGAIVLYSPVLTANSSVRLTCHTVAVRKAPTHIVMYDIVTTRHTIRFMGARLPTRAYSL